MRLLLLAAAVFFCSPQLSTAQPRNSLRIAKPLVTHISTADAAAHTFNGRLHVYVSHDTAARSAADSGAGHRSSDFHLLRSEAGGGFRDLGSVLRLDAVPWARRQLRAPDAAEKDGRYFLYFSARDSQGRFRLGVARSDAPDGPFQASLQPVEGSFSTDPAVLRDDDGRQYMFFGGLGGGQLQGWSAGRFDSAAAGPKDHEPALGPMIAKLRPDMMGFAESPSGVIINDSNGRRLLAGDHARRFFEGAWVHKYGERYYLTYATGNSHRLVYATSRNPYGPYTYRGVLLPPVAGWCTHASVVPFDGRWFLFYHESTLPDGRSTQRCVKMTEIRYDTKGLMHVVDPEG